MKVVTLDNLHKTINNTKNIKMAGIGDYKKGGKFTLKSGNSPMFKSMGSSSPIRSEVDPTVQAMRD